MKCPHCGRSWEEAELTASMPASVVLDDHVRRFCRGEPEPPMAAMPAAAAGRRPAPQRPAWTARR